MKRERILSAVFLISLALLSVSGFVQKAGVTSEGGAIDRGDTAWLLAASGLVLLMTPGLGFFYGGMVNAKNVVSTIFQSVIAMGVVSFVWIVVGFSLSFGPSFGGVIGDPTAYFLFSNVGPESNSTMGATIPFILYALFQLKFAIITPALITGALAERIRFGALLVFMGLWSLFVYAPLAHSAWAVGGILREMGVLDFAGGTVVHISAGMAALAGAMYLGPRSSKKNGEEEVISNVPYVVMGTGLLWFGWFGFNAGSSLAADGLAVTAFLNTNTASSVAMLTWIALDVLRGKKPSAVGACIGAVVGLVAITPAAGFVTVGASLAIGLIAAVISNQLVSMRNMLPFDDALDVFACHGVGGIVGMILTAVFALNGGVIQGETKLMVAHLIGLVGVVTFTFVMSYTVFIVTNLLIPLRVTEEEEEEGLDLSQHGEMALGATYGTPLISQISEHLRDLDHGKKAAESLQSAESAGAPMQ
jgi:Amt family ammonium transporter